MAETRNLAQREPSRSALVAVADAACEADPDMALHFPTRAERPGHLPHAASLSKRDVWPEFLYHDPTLERLFGRVIAEYAEFQFYAWDDEREEVVGAGMAVPAWWDGEASLPSGGLSAIVEARFAEGAPEPTALCALQILIAPECRGDGLSSRMIRRMAEIGRDHGLDTLVAPVRPTLKHLYPLTPMERYIGWRREDGTHFDPWLRTHERLGAEIVKVAPQSTSAPGTVAEWEEWAQMAFPETGAYVVPGALVPVEIDRECDEGLYVEPNVWMVHPRG
jgi:GNAT superfamily N-acetyltransferase